MKESPHIDIFIEDPETSQSKIHLNIVVNELDKCSDFYNKVSLSITGNPLLRGVFEYKNVTISLSENRTNKKGDKIYLGMRLRNLKEIAKKLKEHDIEPFREYENLKGRAITIIKDPCDNYIEFSENLTKQ